MTKDTEPKHIPHKGKNTAYHMDWEFRREACVWVGERPVGPNFHPLGTDLRNWMLRKGTLRVFSPENSCFTNPYSFDASFLTGAFASIVNDCHAFANTPEPLDSLDAEIKGVRLYTEYVLYAARICEALIKQLLFCTTFSDGNYQGAALGALLSKDCNGCQGSKEKRHKVSMLGSLAHRYRLCHGYEQCLNKDMKMVNQRRDVEAAHSGVTKFARNKSIDLMRKKFNKEVTEIGNNLIHMLEHIGEIEHKMLAELDTLIIQGAESVCPVVNAFKVTNAKPGAAEQ